MAAYAWNGKDHNIEFTADALIDFIIWVRRRAWGLSGHKWAARLLYEQYYANIHDKILHKENWGGKDSLYGVKLNFFECRSEF